MGAKERGVWGQLRASLFLPPPFHAPELRSSNEKDQIFHRQKQRINPPPPANELADIFAFISLNREKPQIS